MNVSEMISVCIPTHIIRASSEPYIENQMIAETILQSYKKLGLKGVNYYIYPDAKFKRTHPELMEKYFAYLESMKQHEEFKDININIDKSQCILINSIWFYMLLNNLKNLTHQEPT